MAVLAGILGTICIIAGIVMAFGGTLGNSVPTVIMAGLVACLGIVVIFMSAGWAITYSIAAGVALPIASWIIFWHIAMPGSRGK